MELRSVTGHHVVSEEDEDVGDGAPRNPLQVLGPHDVDLDDLPVRAAPLLHILQHLRPGCSFEKLRPGTGGEVLIQAAYLPTTIPLFLPMFCRKYAFFSMSYLPPNPDPRPPSPGSWVK